jgi:hypothetical protein
MTASKLGHPQPPTPIKTDNTTAHGILTKSLRPKLSKAFEMRFHWMKDRIQQKQFHLYWEKVRSTWQIILQNITLRDITN